MPSNNPAPGFQKRPNYPMSIKTTDKSVTVMLGERVLAETNSALLLKEADYPEVFYIPQQDIKMDELVATNTTSFCPFKGTASYWKIKKAPTKDLENLDICWSYEDPFYEASAIGSHIAFYADRVTVTPS